MTEKLATPVVLRGVVRSLEVIETTVDAFQSEMLRTKTGAAGAVAAAAGLSGIAAGMVAMSMDEMREGAFGVSFEVDGKLVRGVLWNCFFQEGDEVEVVAEDMGDHWSAFAVARPSDRTIALFPHVVSGTIAHFKTSFFIWLKFSLVLILSTLIFASGVVFFFGEEVSSWITLSTVLVGGGVMASLMFAIIGFNISRKYLPFVRIAESVFTALGWQDVKRINLRKHTMKTIRPDDPPALGPFFFRY